MSDDDSYFIWSNEHSAWWRPNSCGYTRHVKQAGRYSRTAAIRICAHTRNGMDLREGKPPSEIPVRVMDLVECAVASGNGWVE